MAGTIDSTSRSFPTLTERYQRPATSEAAESGSPGFPAISAGTAPEAAGPTTSFADVLGDALQQARALEAGANEEALKLSRGEGGLHETMIAQEKAAIGVRYAITMKNRALEAYKELLQTQI